MLSSDQIKLLIENDVPAAFRVPGGAIAILKSGELIAKHTWGYANIDTRSPIEATTVFPICSISKQMVCLLLTTLMKDPSSAHSIESALKSLLPTQTTNPDLTISRLVGMQSGLRDYWALSVLWGAIPQQRFSIYTDTPESLSRLGKFHFQPGTEFSYSNTNFMLVGLAIEKATSRTLSSLLDEHVFRPAKMTTAALRVDTAQIPSPMVGYEGSETMGYIPYSNRIEWAGDAGVQASLEDMIAYEKFIHNAAKDSSSVYSQNAQNPSYSDGRPANYGNGLVFSDIDGEKLIGHSGGLAGFRLRRTYAPDHDISVICLLNSHTDTKLVVDHCFRKLLGTSPESAPNAYKGQDINISWTGNYFDDEAKIAVVVTQTKPGKIVVNYAGHDGDMTVFNDNEATCKEMKIKAEGDVLKIDRMSDGRTFQAKKMKEASGDASEFLGEWYSEDVDSKLIVAGSGSMLYGAFDGYLGKGPMHVMRRISEDVWWLACFRSLDAPAPGNWTVAFSKDRKSLTVSCWLARNVEYRRVK